ncbi:phosphopantetheine-binding protein [Micromonospora sp. BL1]|uniref:phosphopantetheine-binding protein n=1 Tax=Micromonospora sp. BL1 TaxID=2478709 RepID=UPI0013152F5E|nr:phosphopantetheine-binding protein [Micromonospora sp. BL1]NED50677.1 acyl carrier protein [Micromonospora aurantiaca]
MSRHDEIRDFLLAEFLPGVPANELSFDEDLVATGILDSLAVYVVVAWLGDRWSVPLAEDALDLADFRSVNTIERFVAARLADPDRTGSPHRTLDEIRAD